VRLIPTPLVEAVAFTTSSKSVKVAGIDEKVTLAAALPSVVVAIDS
jgi:hypothetical protein